MRSNRLIFVKFLTFLCFAISCFGQDFDFFYFVLTWPGSYCDTKRSCCYPTSGKPAADFGIHGLWPNYNNGSFPHDCDVESEFDKSQITDLINSLEEKWPTLSCPSNDGTKFWKHEWEKHGTCSESELDQHEYFETTLKLRDQIDLLQILKNAGIEPDDKFYEVDKIRTVIREAIGFTPGIKCNKDPSRNSQLYEIYLCVDTSGTEFIECPILPVRKCASEIQFPQFGDALSSHIPRKIFLPS